MLQFPTEYSDFRFNGYYYDLCDRVCIGTTLPAVFADVFTVISAETHLHLDYLKAMAQRYLHGVVMLTIHLRYSKVMQMNMQLVNYCTPFIDVLNSLPNPRSTARLCSVTYP